MEIELKDREKEILAKYFKKINDKQLEIEEINKTISDIVSAIAARGGIEGNCSLDVRTMKVIPLEEKK